MTTLQHSQPPPDRRPEWAQVPFMFQPTLDHLQALLRDLDGACWRIQRFMDVLVEGRSQWPGDAAATVRRASRNYAELREFAACRQLSDRVSKL